MGKMLYVVLERQCVQTGYHTPTYTVSPLVDLPLMVTHVDRAVPISAG